MIDVSIIFVNYKTKDLTINAINSVIDKTENLEYEIFVVDNNSQDGSIDAIENVFPNINIIRNSVNAGFGAANNIAIKQARGKYIFCLNTDTLLINNAIKIMFDYMEKEENQNIGVCGGILVNREGKPCVCGGNFPTLTDILWKFGIRNIFKKSYLNYKTNLNSDEIYDTKNDIYITGADIFFRKSVLDQIGLFDEQFFMYFEETDLCKRIIDAKFDIKFIPEAKIIHLEGMSEKDSLQKKLRAKKSEMYYFKKHYSYMILIVKILYIILYLIGWLILRHPDDKSLLCYTIGLGK